jgi:hypothetical protein
MYHSGRRSHMSVLLTGMITCLCLLSLSTAPAWAAAGTITEFPLPRGSGDPTSKVIGSLRGFLVQIR